MPTPLSIEELLGDPRKVAADLQQFRQDAKILSDDPTLVDIYNKRWIAVYDGAVRADDSTLPRLMRKIKALGLPKERVVARYIDRHQRTMILPACF